MYLDLPPTQNIAPTRLRRATPDTTGIAHAADSAALNGGVSSVAQTQQTSITPKTRAEVRHELPQAEQDGELARLQSLYHGG